MVALINGFQRSFQQSIQSLGNNTHLHPAHPPGRAISAAACPDSLQAAARVHHGRRRARSSRTRPRCARSRRSSSRSPTFGSSYRDHHTKTTFLYGTNEAYLRHARLRPLARPVLHAAGGAAPRQRRRAGQGHARGAVRGRERPRADGAPQRHPVHGHRRVRGEGQVPRQQLRRGRVRPLHGGRQVLGGAADAPPWFPKKGELFLDAIADRRRTQSRAGDDADQRGAARAPAPAEQQAERFRGVQRRRVPVALQDRHRAASSR